VERVGVTEADEAGCVAAFEYGGALATAITRLKYSDRADVAPRLARAMLGHARRVGPVDLVVPVPLHPRRLADRGYNQAALLAVTVARALGAPLVTQALRRIRDTPNQASQGRAPRLANVRGAFLAVPSLIRGRRVLLVDDVRTTGATLSACREGLQAAGARHVSALVLARRGDADTARYHQVQNLDKDME
jgi:ComF family protein